MVLYNITIYKPDGTAELSRWPIEFTEDFNEYIGIDDGKPIVSDSGLQLLQDNRLWLQIIDENGEEIFSYHKPEMVVTHYTPSALINGNQNKVGEDTIFLGSIVTKTCEWTYIIGFPIHISKITIYGNGDRLETFKPIVLGMLGVTLILLIASSIIYSYFIARQLKQIRGSIKSISARTYISVEDRGSFHDVYEELNTLNDEIKIADEARKRDEKLREEWIANVTHDLKTPLSLIKGYVELISTTDDEIPLEELKQYGDVIRKNLTYAEDLINDLKLTYQLKNGMLPLNRSQQNLVRFTKELMIDLINHPEYRNRKICYIGTDEDIKFSFDTMLLKRAVNNLLVNALIHNQEDTEINVSVNAVNNCIYMMIQDNGEGMDQEELDHLFTRYYRGEKMKTKPEGTGLGMAIAAQIVELHGGEIRVESEKGHGTSMILEFAVQS